MWWLSSIFLCNQFDYYSRSFIFSLSNSIHQGCLYDYGWRHCERWWFGCDKEFELCEIEPDRMLRRRSICSVVNVICMFIWVTWFWFPFWQRSSRSVLFCCRDERVCILLIMLGSMTIHIHHTFYSSEKEQCRLSFRRVFRKTRSNKFEYL